MIIALSGCVIVDDHASVTIKEKCEKCGAISSGTNTLPPIPRGAKAKHKGRCKKCGATFDIVLENRI